MVDEILRYDVMIENALRSIVRQTLESVVKNGLPGEHHFYITFETQHPNVKIPQHLHDKFPEEMTIVLQHQFFGLKVNEDGFSVMLSFNNVNEKLEIPFDAITTFADPAVNFALQFRSSMDSDDGDEDDDIDDDGNIINTPQAKKKPADDGKRGEVISLDMFRKKTEQTPPANPEKP